MLDGFLGRGFTSKCKSSIKLIKARIDVIRRKRNAMQKFLKKDIADLLANGLDTNAYGRAEGLIVELNLSSCYDLVEQFCGCILKQLSVMQKQMECPEECREAVPSLMFAAARFADLPELRDLRHVFAERFEKSLESFVNQEFVEKLASKPPTKDKKIQLMRDIAQEFSIKWDFKAFEHKMSSPLAPSQDRPKKHGSVHDSNDDGYKSHNGKNDAVPKTENQEVSSRGRRQPTGDQLKPHNEENTVLKRNNQDLMSHGRQELTDDGYNPHNARGSTVLKGDKPDVLSHGKREQTGDGNKSSNGREDTVLRRGNQDVSSRGQRELTGDGYKLCSDREDSLLRRNHQDLWSCGRREFTEDMYKPKRDTPDGLSHGREECINDGHKLCNGREDIVPKRDNGATPSEGRMEFTPTYPTRQQVKAGSRDIPVAGDNNFPQNHAHSINKVFKEDTESMKPLYNNAVPPVKMRGSKHRTSSEAQHTSPDCNEAPTDPPIHNRDITKNRSERTHTRCDRVDYERQPDGPARVNDYGDGKGPQRQNDVVDDAKPKPRPRSVRRRHKPPPGHDNIGNLEYDEAAKRNPSGRTREDARQGLQTLLPDHDPMDEEEKMMDKWLIHYSKKTSTYEPRKVRMGLKAPPLHQIAADNAESPRYRSRHGANFNSESTHAPARVMSLPPEPTVPKEVARAPARASSFQPEMLNPAPHVHPKLPDYDDLAAQFAALRGR